MNLSLFLFSCVNAGISLSLARWSFTMRHRNSAALSMCHLASLSFFWNLFYAAWQWQTDEYWAQVFCQALMVPAGLLGVPMLRAALIYSGRHCPRLLLLSRFCGYTHAVLCFVPGMVVAHMDANIAGVLWWPHAGPAFLLFLITFTIGFAWGSWQIVTHLLRKAGSKAEGVRLVVGMSFGFLGGATNLPAWYYPTLPDLPPFGHPLISFLSVFMAASLLRAQTAVVSPRIIRFCSQVIVALVTTLGVTALIHYGVLDANYFRGELSAQIGAVSLIVVIGVLWVIVAVPEMTRLIAGAFSPSMIATERLLQQTQSTVKDSDLETLGTRAAQSLCEEVGLSCAAIYEHHPDTSEAVLVGSARCAPESSIALSESTLNILKTERKFFVLPRGLFSGRFVYCTSAFIHDDLKLFLLAGANPQGVVIDANLATAIDSLILSVHFQRRLLTMAREEAASLQLKELGVMSATLAHDFRNPMTSVKFYLNQPVGDSMTNEVRLQAATDLQRMEAAVYSVLEFADIRNASQKHDLHEVMDKIAVLLQSEMSWVNFVNEIPVGAIYVRAPYHLLVTLFSQFFKNAVAAMSANHVANPTIRVRAQAQGGKTVVAVSDNGPGVAPEVRPRLFRERVTTSTDHTAKRNSGFGIGLYSSGMMAKRLGWDLRYAQFVESDGDQFSFLVELPSSYQTMDSRDPGLRGIVSPEVG